MQSILQKSRKVVRQVWLFHERVSGRSQLKRTQSKKDQLLTSHHVFHCATFQFQITLNTHTPSISRLSHLTVAIQSSSSSSAPCPAGPSLPQRRLTLRDWCQPRKAAVTGSLQNHPPDTADPPPPPPPLSRPAAMYQLGLDASIATYVEKQKLSTSAFFRFAALRLQYGWRSSMMDAEWQEAGLIYNDHFAEIKPVFYNTSFPLPRDEVERSVQTLKLHCADFERRISSKVASALADKSERFQPCR